ncbi:MAG: chemotaxis protein CheX [Actinomyces sp.]|jgi:hypothetical protein|nr:chemotaxis protein CheX [Actinomyces sp.]
MDTGSPSEEQQVLGIAQDLFAAMVDGGTDGLGPWAGPMPGLEAPLHAWVDAIGEAGTRTLVSAGEGTCRELARRLLGLGDADPLEQEDLLDAMREVANIIGGNVKSLMPGAGRLTPPGADTAPPPGRGSRRLEVRLRWRGAPILVSLWSLTDDETEERNR